MTARKEICDCGWLERLSKEPASPVQFDPQMNEYLLRHGACIYRIRYCPFCGGGTPPSRRQSFFAYISNEERSRLSTLLSGLKNEADVLARFGAPDWETDGVVTIKPEKDGVPEQGEAAHTLRYTRLSDVANVHISLFGDGRVFRTWSAKSLRKRTAHPSLEISACTPEEWPTMGEIINDAAQAYKGAIPPDRWHEPYMPMPELESEIGKGVRFFGARMGDRLVGVMGIQDVKDVMLIRHAYVRTEQRGKGIGRELLEFLRGLTERPILIGTWKAATWAIRFYEKNGFTLVGEEEKNQLLKTYWTVPARQIEESVVLADDRWRAQHGAPR